MQQIESFVDEEQAYGEIAEAGWHALAMDFPAESNEFHWHDFDAVVYITGGELTLTVEGEESPYRCGRGDKFQAAAGVVHREDTPGYSAIIGFSVAPEQLTQPINKPPVNETATLDRG